MKRHTLRIAAAFLTFVVGVSATLALVRDAHVVAPPPVQPGAGSGANEKVLEMVFVLDTTGSMGGLIDGAKQRIWGIVNEVMQSPASPSVRVGLVASRDTGDSYGRCLPLTNDLDKVTHLMLNRRRVGDWAENVPAASPTA